MITIKSVRQINTKYSFVFIKVYIENFDKTLEKISFKGVNKKYLKVKFFIYFSYFLRQLQQNYNSKTLNTNKKNRPIQFNTYSQTLNTCSSLCLIFENLNLFYQEKTLKENFFNI